MSEKKGWGASLLGVFVVRDDDRAPQAAEEEAGSDTAAGGSGSDGTGGGLQDGAATSSSSVPGNAFRSAGLPPLGLPVPGAAPTGPSAPRASQTPDGTPAAALDLPAIYTAAGISAEEQARVGRAADLLHALPEGSEGSRQIVEASLKAFGIPIDEIIAAGEKEIRALDGCVAAGAAEARQLLAESQQRIGQYEQEITRIRQIMDDRVAEQQALERACAGSKLDLARVLGFFGHAPSASAAPAAPAAPPKAAGAPSSAPSPTNQAERSH